MHNNHPHQQQHLRSGVLTIRIFSGRNLNLAPNVPLPAVIQQALASGVAQGGSGAQGPSNKGNRESLQRKRSWWLPYLVLQFDKQEVFIDALGGEMHAPAWMYKAHL